MTDLEFLNHAETLLRQVEQHCDRINDESDADIDNQRVGGMITLTFANRPVLWCLATRSGGYHYRFVDGQWQDTKGQGEFWSRLSTDASAQSGQALHFSS